MHAAQARNRSLTSEGIGTRGGPETCLNNLRGRVMKLYLLYLLITAIAVLAHLGARKTAASETDEAAV